MRTALACSAFLIAIAFYGALLFWFINALVTRQFPPFGRGMIYPAALLVGGTAFVCLGAKILDRES